MQICIKHGYCFGEKSVFESVGSGPYWSVVSARPHQVEKMEARVSAVSQYVPGPREAARVVDGGDGRQRVAKSEATPSDLYFEISNGAPFTLLGMWEELLILGRP